MARRSNRRLLQRRRWPVAVGAKVFFERSVEFHSRLEPDFAQAIGLGCSLRRKPDVQERVRAGLRNARAKGKRLGRPRAKVDESQIAELRHSGASWRTIAKELGVGLGTIHRLSRVR